MVATGGAVSVRVGIHRQDIVYGVVLAAAGGLPGLPGAAGTAKPVWRRGLIGAVDIPSGRVGHARDGHSYQVLIRNFRSRVMLLHIFRGPGRVFGITEDAAGANLPARFAPWSAFKSIELSRGGEPTPGVNA